MAVFIDDVIVGTETEEGHDELVAEVIKRLEENDLYVKPEKCKWKVLWDAWDMNNFYFLFLLFSDFIGILFSFSFYFGQ